MALLVPFVARSHFVCGCDSNTNGRHLSMAGKRLFEHLRIRSSGMGLTCAVFLVSNTKPFKRAAAERMRDTPQADGQRFTQRILDVAVEFAVQDLPGDVQPRGAIGCQSGVLGFQQVQQFAFVLTQHVGELRRTLPFGDHRQLVACRFEPQAAPGRFDVMELRFLRRESRIVSHTRQRRHGRNRPRSRTRRTRQGG